MHCWLQARVRHAWGGCRDETPAPALHEERHPACPASLCAHQAPGEAGEHAGKHASNGSPDDHEAPLLEAAALQPASARALAHAPERLVAGSAV